ncbi:380_t:CDS:2 [Gigaspora rosea]|nr:380_t:CDS:2 [Gigaspora rosea]
MRCTKVTMNVLITHKTNKDIVKINFDNRHNPKPTSSNAVEIRNLKHRIRIVDEVLGIENEYF